MTDTDKDAIFGKDLRVYDTKSLEHIHFEPELIEDIYSRLGINKPKEAYQQIVQLNLIKVAYKMGHNEGTHKNQMTENKTQITRIEVIDENGRSYVNWKDDNDITTSYQDDGRTLKVFVNKVRTKSPAEEAFKRVSGGYPDTSTDDYGEYYCTTWKYFSRGYNAAQDYKVGEYQPTPQEPSMINCMIEGPPPNEYPSWSEWFSEMGSKGILHNLKISSLGEDKFQPTPQTENEVAEGLRSAFREAQQTEEWKETQRKIDSNYDDMVAELKGQNLYDLIADWWDEIFVNGNPSGQNIESLVEKIKHWLPKEQSANSQNAYVECTVEGFNDAITKIKNKLK